MTDALPVPMLDLQRQYQSLQTELDSAVLKVMREGRYIYGPEVAELEQTFAAYTGVKHAIGCANGSEALLLSLQALGLQPDDEVILPSFTFFATAAAVSRLRGKPVFADIHPDTFNIDPEDVKARITKKTKVILPVHLFGQCADMSAIQKIADDSGLAVLEDNAQAIGSTQAGKAAGSMGALSTVSFYPTKNIGANGDAGMVMTDDDDLAANVRSLCRHGESKERYRHDLVGMNSRLDTLQAAILLVKFKMLDHWNYQRREHAQRYQEQLSDIDDLQLPVVGKDNHHIYHHFTIRSPRRDDLMKHLRSHDIGCAVYYPVGLHVQPCFEYLGGKESDLPVTKQAIDEVLSIPVFPEMTAPEQDKVISHIRAFFQAGP